MKRVIWNCRKCRTSYCEISMIQNSASYEVHYYSEEDSYMNVFKNYSDAFKAMMNLLKELE
jgi:hypothetical protein